MVDMNSKGPILKIKKKQLTFLVNIIKKVGLGNLTIVRGIERRGGEMVTLKTLAN